MYELKLFY